MESAKKMKASHVARDDAGNVVFRVESSPGLEKVPMITFQGHQDMVCVADKEHDFEKDPITFVRQSKDWICADQTTLGADNGVSMACSLCLCEELESFNHGPLEFLFTVEEEIGLQGIKKMDPSFVKGKYLINLDSDECGTIVCGCAGGAQSDLFLPVEYSKSHSFKFAVDLEVRSLLGGHSGCDIGKERANAVKFLSGFLFKLLKDRNLKFGVSSFVVDSNYNEIPSKGKIRLLFGSEEDKLVIDKLVELHSGEIIDIYESVGDNKFKFTSTSFFGNMSSVKIWTCEFLNKFVRVCQAIPHGVHRYSHDLENCVETSNNLANCMLMKDPDNLDMLRIGVRARSMKEKCLNLHIDQVQAICHLGNFGFNRGKSYPGWTPNMDSDLLKISESTWNRFFENTDVAKAKVRAVHAGMECGIILSPEMKPEMEAISIGPNIENLHSTKERMHIPSVPIFYDFVVELIKEISKKKQ